MNRFAWLRRAVVAVIGFTVLLIGVAMIALPGPAIVVIPLGLGILATEFVWARRLLAQARAKLPSRLGGTEPVSGDKTEDAEGDKSSPTR